MRSAVRRLLVVSLAVLTWIAVIGVALETYSRYRFSDNPFGVNTLNEIVFEPDSAGSVGPIYGRVRPTETILFRFRSPFIWTGFGMTIGTRSCVERATRSRKRSC